MIEVFFSATKLFRSFPSLFLFVGSDALVGCATFILLLILADLR